jgi:chromate transporter
MGVPRPSRTLAEVAAVFARLGATSFGGPAAHIALMRQEVVVRRRWVSDQEFLDLVSATNLIPGPNSTEMAIHLGYRRAGWPGLAVAGVCFIAPAMITVLAVAWAYVRFGALPDAAGVLYGVKPVIVAVVVQALWGLGRVAIRDALTAAVGMAALVLYLRGAHEIGLLAAGGLAVAAARRVRGGLPAAVAPVAGMAGGTAAAVPFALDRLALIFLKIGSVLYGSGYVLLAFVRADLVVRLGWLTDQQLLDAVAVGQVTPGPVFTTATFIGYLLGGLPGALVATGAIFAPAFVFVALSHPLVPRMRQSAAAGAVLDGINVTSLALMAGVSWQLARTAVVDLPTALLAVAAAVVLFRARTTSAWLVAGGGLAGWIVRAAAR